MCTQGCLLPGTHSRASPGPWLWVLTWTSPTLVSSPPSQAQHPQNTLETRPVPPRETAARHPLLRPALGVASTRTLAPADTSGGGPGHTSAGPRPAGGTGPGMLKRSCPSAGVRGRGSKGLQGTSHLCRSQNSSPCQPLLPAPDKAPAKATLTLLGTAEACFPHRLLFLVFWVPWARQTWDIRGMGSALLPLCPHRLPVLRRAMTAGYMELGRGWARTTVRHPPQ